jgi:hypothetical protein
MYPAPKRPPIRPVHCTVLHASKSLRILQSTESGIDTVSQTNRMGAAREWRPQEGEGWSSSMQLSEPLVYAASTLPTGLCVALCSVGGGAQSPYANYLVAEYTLTTARCLLSISLVLSTTSATLGRPLTPRCRHLRAIASLSWAISDRCIRLDSSVPAVWLSCHQTLYRYLFI